ncbi:hypothetical protein [Novosphingobium sp. KACC 22771]|uniref:hypothetical protein n=1 Tax=Novosphingobium sp. KACC 22771 TaxID=3025670 RepID=UPI002366AA76|nr:hypothetical protein [Novosphingobium sp. KACC 22771]WDF73259.1 hypothetical protein PQ467_04230 [Novosphingobium sp. KACC 22771]
MKAERDKLKRLQRLERVRAIAKQTLATEAARAEGTYTQMMQLAERTGQLAADYAARTDIADGAALREMNRFAAGLQGIRAATQADANRAQAIADKRQQELAMAERRRAAVEDRATAQARQIAARQSYAAMAGAIQSTRRRDTQG